VRGGGGTGDGWMDGWRVAGRHVGRQAGCQDRSIVYCSLFAARCSQRLKDVDDGWRRGEVRPVFFTSQSQPGVSWTKARSCPNGQRTPDPRTHALTHSTSTSQPPPLSSPVLSHLASAQTQITPQSSVGDAKRLTESQKKGKCRAAVEC
jgi:hypothetical protein